MIHVPDRYELKYVVPQWQVGAIRDAIRPFCGLDAHSAAAADGQYAIHSIYFDTPGFDLYRVSRERRARRFKVRARGYGDRPDDGPVFLEVKRRLKGIVRKSRAPVASGWAARLRAPATAAASPAEEAFRNAVDLYHLEPVLLVRYDREAWVSAVDEYARVTFDRHLVAQPWGRLGFGAGREAWLPLDDRPTLRAVPSGVVLELKCTKDVPRWMARLVERFALRRVGVSKYCNAVERVWGGPSLRRGLAPCAGGDRP